jgi:DNA-binding NarL/FixJ family response regulator
MTGEHLGFVSMVFKALVVCADENVTEALLRVLKELDIDAEHCVHQSLGLVALSEDRYDAVIVDCADGASAAEIVKKAHASGLNASTLVIALLQSEENTKEMFAMGANFVLYKPVSLERVRSSLQAARSMMRREKRRHERVAVHTPAGLTYANVENMPATLIDLSEEGVAIQSERPLPKPGKVYFQFTLPNHSEVVRLSGEVVWQDSSGRVGLRFADVPQTSRRLLKAWLQQHQPQKSGVLETRPKSEATLAKSAETEKRKEPVATDYNPESGLGRLRSMPGNRRGQFRRACSLGAEVYQLGTTVPNRCRLSDISPGGCYVEMPTPLAAESKVEILVRTKDLKIRTRGVVQAAHPGFGMGVKFNPRNAAEHEQIQQLISLLESQQELEPML